MVASKMGDIGITVDCQLLNVNPSKSVRRSNASRPTTAESECLWRTLRNDNLVCMNCSVLYCKVRRWQDE